MSNLNRLSRELGQDQPLLAGLGEPWGQGVEPQSSGQGRVGLGLFGLGLFGLIMFFLIENGWRACLFACLFACLAACHPA